MVTEGLKQCVTAKADELNVVLDDLLKILSIQQNPSLSLSHRKLTEELLKELTEMANTLNSVSEIIDARECAYEFLKKLPLSVGSDEMTEYNGMRISFNNARLLGFQSYLSTTWSICDLLTWAFAPLMLGKSHARNRESPPNLLTEIINDYRDKKNKVAYFTSFILFRSYGWSIAVSYIIRNHFVHDGALHCGYSFFEGRGVDSRYQISEKGWEFLEEKMKAKHAKTDSECTRVMQPWPWYKDDLLELLSLCNKEIDEALSCLVYWSVGIARLQVDCMLQRDGLESICKVESKG